MQSASLGAFKQCYCLVPWRHPSPRANGGGGMDSSFPGPFTLARGTHGNVACVISPCALASPQLFTGSGYLDQRWDCSRRAGGWD